VGVYGEWLTSNESFRDGFLSIYYLPTSTHAWGESEGYGVVVLYGITIPLHGDICKCRGNSSYGEESRRLDDVDECGCGELKFDKRKQETYEGTS
jgi:hypothetical protein